MSSRRDDRSLGMDRPITRRDFCQGIALAAGSLPLLNPAVAALAAQLDPDYYPPLLTGLRGSHAGSFEVAHALAREGRSFAMPEQQTDDSYDLVVVGGGISGLAAAWYYGRARPQASILILDNHDDFGGHAKRNEFRVDGRLMLCHGGSQSIDTPARYSEVARRFLVDLGIDVERFRRYYDQDFPVRHGLADATFFDAAHYGQSKLVHGGGFGWEVWLESGPELIAQMPLSERARADLLRLLRSEEDHLPGLDRDGKIRYLSETSYDRFLLDEVGVDRAVVDLLQARPQGYWGAGTDALPAIELYRMGFPGFAGMDLGLVPGQERIEQPYIFHFPDGNASIARMLVRQMLPDIAPGGTMEDVVTARFRYDRLDRAGERIRIRLNSTAVRVEESGDGHVDVAYVSGGEIRRVRGRHAVLACWHTMIPHLCPQLDEAQRSALAYQVKVPLVWTSVVLRNWRALRKLGVGSAYCPHGYYSWVSIDFPVSMGDYGYSRSPDEAIALYMIRAPAAPNRGLSLKEQFRIGRAELFGVDFATFERQTRAQLAEMFGAGGFDPARDIAAITVNRWPHGYAYEYVELWDPEFPPGRAPHEIARRPFGRIAIANSDAEAHAYVDGAVDAAYRAAKYVLGR